MSERLTADDVAAMGLALGPVCEDGHGRKMQPHQHIALPATTPASETTYAVTGTAGEPTTVGVSGAEDTGNATGATTSVTARPSAPSPPASETVDAARFLSWVADRFVNVYGESPNVDFVLLLRREAAIRAESDERVAALRSALRNLETGHKNLHRRGTIDCPICAVIESAALDAAPEDV